MSAGGTTRYNMNKLVGMGLNAWVGKYADEAAALNAIRGASVDTTGNGSGVPQEGMLFFNTTSKELLTWDATAVSWVGLNRADSVRFPASRTWMWLLAGATDVDECLARLDLHLHTSLEISDFTEKARNEVGAILVDSATILAEYDTNANAGAGEISHEVAPTSISAAHLASAIDMSSRGFNAAQVAGTQPNDSGSTVADLWTAEKIQGELDNIASGLRPHAAVRVATTIRLADESWCGGCTYDSGASTIESDANEEFGSVDGVTISQADRILVQHGASSTNSVEVGVYALTNAGNASSSTWVLTRESDFAAGLEAQGHYVPVMEGILNDQNLFICISDDGEDVVDTDPLEFKAFGSVTTHNAMSGLQGGNVGLGEMYHLSDAQRVALTTGGEGSGQHHHDNYYIRAIDLANPTPGSEGATRVGTANKVNLGGATNVEAALSSIDSQFATAGMRPLNGTTQNPNNVHTPRYIGDMYVCTLTSGMVWVARSTAITGWEVI